MKTDSSLEGHRTKKRTPRARRGHLRGGNF